MYQKPSVPRSIGGVLDDTLQLYKASFSKCWLPLLLASLAEMGLGLYKLHDMPAVAAGSGIRQLLAEYVATTPGYQVTSILVALFQWFIYCMLVVIITAVSQGKVSTFGDSFSTTLRRFPATIGASIIAGIAAVVGFLLLIIPGFYVLNRMQLFAVPALTESVGPGESVGISWRLVGGNWWRTATLVFVMIVMVYILDLVLVSLTGAVAVVVAGAPANVVQGISKFAAVGVVSSAIVSIFTRPLMVAVIVAVYQDLLLRQGGADLEARLGALPKG